MLRWVLTAGYAAMSHSRSWRTVRHSTLLLVRHGTVRWCAALPSPVEVAPCRSLTKLARKAQSCRGSGNKSKRPKNGRSLGFEPATCRTATLQQHSHRRKANNKGKRKRKGKRLSFDRKERAAARYPWAEALFNRAVLGDQAPQSRAGPLQGGAGHI